MTLTACDIDDLKYHRRVDYALLDCPVCGGPLPCEACLNDLRNDEGA